MPTDVPAPPSRIVFAGTPEFAAVSLRSLIGAGMRPELVLTQPDRPAGRGRRTMASEVKAVAVDHGIEVLQPTSLRTGDATARLRALEPDALVVAAYGLLLPQPVLDVPRVACVNVHASLLPRWRGAAPIQSAILAGDAQTGVSLMKMDAGLDTGPVYCERAIAIGPDETGGELHDRLATLGGELLAATLPAILAGRLEPQPQDDAAATYAPRLSKDDAHIDWERPADEIARAVRAFNPWPVCHTSIDGETLRCWRAAPLLDEHFAEPGTIVRADRGGVFVACGSGTLRLDELQAAGRRRIAAADFANQRSLTGIRLGG